MNPALILEIGKSIAVLAGLIHGDNLAKVKDASQQLAAVVVAQLPDGSQITEAELVAHCDQVIADAEARRQLINSAEPDPTPEA